MAALDNLVKIPGRAMARALNNVLRHAQTQAVKEIREYYTITAQDLKKEISVSLASGSRLIGSINVRREVIPLGKFAPLERIVQTPRGRRVGVSVKVKRKESRKFVRGGFQPLRHIGTSDIQRKKIFKTLTEAGEYKKRIATKGKRKGKMVNVIVAKFSLSAAQMFVKHGEAKLQQVFDTDLYLEFNKELENYLNRERSRAA